jgi:hypothetical protein
MMTVSGLAEALLRDHLVNQRQVADYRDKR